MLEAKVVRQRTNERAIPAVVVPKKDRSQPEAEVDKVGLDISAQYTRIYPYSVP